MQRKLLWVWLIVGSLIMATSWCAARASGQCVGPQCPTYSRGIGIGVGVDVGGWRVAPPQRPKTSRPQRPVSSPDPHQSYSSIPPQVVAITAYYDHGREGYGSGTVIEQKDGAAYVLTCWHGTEGRIIVNVTGKGRYQADMCGSDPDWDIAVLAIKDPGVGAVARAPTMPRRGERITTIGFFPTRYVEFSGLVKDFVTHLNSDDPYMITVSGSGGKGGSGSGMLDSEGYLTAVFTGEDPGDKVMIGTCVAPLAGLIDGWINGAPEPQPPLVPVEPTAPPKAEPDMNAMREELAALRARLAALEAIINGDVLVTQVAKRLPGITFQPVDGAGNPAGDPATKRLGETLKLRGYLVEKPQP